MAKVLSIIFASIILIAIIIGGVVIYQWQQFIAQPLVTKTQVFELAPGTSVKKLVRELSEQGIVKHPFYFEWLVRLRGDGRRLQAG